MITRLEQAAHDTAQAYRGGVQALAERVGMRPSTLYKKLDPGCETHHLTIPEALALMLSSGDFRILNAMADSCGFTLIPKSGDDAGTLFDLMCRISEESGLVAAEVRDSLADGRLSGSERQMIGRKVANAVEGLQTLARFIQTEDGR
jgi:hypothetical protein